jgi:hypothetical protein
MIGSTLHLYKIDKDKCLTEEKRVRLFVHTIYIMFIEINHFYIHIIHISIDVFIITFICILVGVFLLRVDY